VLTARIYKAIEQRHARKISAFLAESQYWPPERIRLYQFEKLQKLLVHAWENVPYYRKMFTGLGIKPEDIRSREDFARLPILTKDIIRSNRNNLVASNFREEQLKPNSTGGSTGEPLHFFQDENYENWADAARIRGWYYIANCKSWDKTAVIWGAMHEVKEDFSLRERLRDFLLYGDVMLNAFNLSEERKEKFLSYCRFVKPRLLRGYTTALKDMARFLEDSGQDFPQIKGIILCAETVDPHTQEYIEKIFKAPSYNTYGGRELSLIGMECAEHAGLHEISENNYVEYEPLSLAGYENAGNLIITNLNNFAMPFIRYRIGDIGVPCEEGECRCGRGLPRIQKVIGRTTEVLSFMDGTRIAGEMFIHLMKDFPLSEYQFVQNSEYSVILRHKKGDHLEHALKKKIEQTYDGYLPDGVTLEFQEVDNIEKTATGKFRFVLKDFSA
jgi:phenylacetate-CoA ligase